MDYIEKQMAALDKRVNARILKLESSIIDLKARQRDDEFVYGVGGAYRRKENAINKREKEIVELKEFVKQIKKPLVAEEIIFSVLYCKECHNEILTQGRTREEWHECKSAVFGIMWGDLFVENIIYGDNDILSGILLPAEICR